jgi:glutaconate CoA-transferase subunit B
MALLGGAQIDRYGNLNTTVVGDYAKPKVRLPGSGGACEIAANARRVCIIMSLSKRAFVDKLDFTTSVGHLSKGMTREQLGLFGAGPQVVITDRALFTFENGEMTLAKIARGETVDSIQSEVGWPLRIAHDLQEMEAPTETELTIIREQLDKDRRYC